VRKCRSCRKALPKLKDCSTRHQEAGFCESDCAYQYATKNAERLREKARQRRDKQDREQKREKNRNNLDHQVELTQKEFNTMIRNMDRGKRCPTCGDPLIDGRYDAGHVRTVAAMPTLSFDARNCFGQCRACNGSGTIRKRTRKTQEAVSELYKQWVMDTMGQAYYDWLYGPHEPRHYTCENLITMRKEYAAEIRRLEKGEKPSKDWRSLE